MVSHRGEHKTRVTGDEAQRTMRRVKKGGEATSRPFSPSRLPLRANFHRKTDSGYEISSPRKRVIAFSDSLAPKLGACAFMGLFGGDVNVNKHGEKRIGMFQRS